MKLDINIERDLAYALKVRECPPILFLHGNRIVYREKGRLCSFALKSCTKYWSAIAANSFHLILQFNVFAEFRAADELVQMIAYFYYNAKKPSWIDKAAIC